MNKHAYMIVAHNQFELLEMIMRLLDNEKNDFFIHIDKSVEDFDFEYFKNLPKHSNVTFVERVNVTWGSHRQIQYELNLLKEAIKGKFSYYHLISGVDMPIKTSEEIYNFFESNNGTDFIHFGSDDYVQKRDIKERISLYHPLQAYIGRKDQLIFKIIRRFHNMVFVPLQRIFHIDRIKKSGLILKTGSNWFSITHKTAEYFCSQEEIIRKYFNFSHCGDEFVLQTIVYSKYKEDLKLYLKEKSPSCECCARLIDWERGSPYTFRSEDYNELINSNCMFARKFDLNVDKDICQKIYNHLINK